ncbi:MAG TPA: MaoC/PaaZ C-terminal domain-containing protein [Allosphingosinicella sp.]|jgi:acyl dehydratase
MAAARYYEDFRLGEVFTTGTHVAALGEMVAFARAHDPQSFHTDAAAAAHHPVFRGLSASGYYTMTVTHRLVLASDPGHAWGLIGKGIDRLRWPRPVRAGDTLTVRGTVAALERDPARPYGIVVTDIETLNQRNEVVQSMTVQAVVPVRAAAVPERRAA